MTNKKEQKIKKPFRIGKMHGGNPNPVPPPKEYQFKKGQSGNPGGRPKVLSTAYKEWLEEINPNDPEGRTNAQLVARVQGYKAMNAKDIGSTNAAKEIRAATEIKPLLNIDVSKLSDDQLERIINGEDPLVVLSHADKGDGGSGEAAADGDTQSGGSLPEVSSNA